MPFRYGIATLTALPHLFVRVFATVDGKTSVGIAADGLSQKWFTKNPDTPYEREIEDMLTVIQSACRLAKEVGEAENVFGLWRNLYAAQKRWAETTQFPPLLWGFGVSLVERAVIEAFCRAKKVAFHDALRSNLFGIELGEIHGELRGKAPAEFLPAEPLSEITVRHTVGITDPLTDADIPAGLVLDDGLPQSLEASIREYGTSQLKIKLLGDPDGDARRLRSIAALLKRIDPEGIRFTLDGNENYRSVEPFRQLWGVLAGDENLRPFLRNLLFVEQPLHRDVSLGDEVRAAFDEWRDHPPVTIDESDASLESLRDALDCGYAGTSYKNCKGVFKGIANVCLIRARNAASSSSRLIASAEDLSNVPPVALQQDLASLASLGIPNPERNGHHYFRGMSVFPGELQTAVLESHGDLMEWHERGFARLRIRDGRIRIRSVVSAPYGRACEFDPQQFTPAGEWRFSSLLP